MRPNQYPKQSSLNREHAKSRGETTYESATPCKTCSGTIKYVVNHSCRKCNIERSLPKLNDNELMAQYRTQEKKNPKLVEWRRLNPDKVKMQRKRALTYQAAYQSGRRIKVRKQTPLEIDKQKIIAIYEEARLLTIKIGIPHEVDHKIPISRGGLHHQDNLQILTQRQNRQKGNKL